MRWSDPTRNRGARIKSLANYLNHSFRLPGPMEWIPEYQARANGQKEIPSLSPEYDEITKDTFGILIYQEQVSA